MQWWVTLLIFLMGKGEKPLKLQCRSKHARWLEVRRGARPGPEMQKVWLTETTITLVILTLMHYWFPTIIFPQTSEKTPPEQSFCTFVCACVSTCALEGRVKTSTTMICFLIRQLERTKQNLIHAFLQLQKWSQTGLRLKWNQECDSLNASVY